MAPCAARGAVLDLCARATQAGRASGRFGPDPSLRAAVDGVHRDP